jgi:chromosome segregation ATPase
MSPQRPVKPAQPAKKPANSMVPAKDEVASFQRRKKGSHSAASHSTTNGSGGNLAVYIVALLLILVSGAGGYWGYTLTNQLSSTQAKLDHALSNLEAVNEQLELTDQVLNQPGGSVQQKLSLYDSEIRKLWGNYQKHRKLIAANEKSITTAKANHTELSKKLTDVSNQSKKTDRSQEAKLKEVSQSVATTNQQINTTTNKLTAQISKLESQIGTLPKQQKSTDLTPLTKKVQGNEEAIVAIDSFRVQTNRTLDKLMKTIAGMQNKLDEISSSATATP